MNFAGNGIMDIEAMKNKGDIHGLIRLLDHRKHDVQWRAADALGNLGRGCL